MSKEEEKIATEGDFGQGENLTRAKLKNANLK